MAYTPTLRENRVTIRRRPDVETCVRLYESLANCLPPSVGRFITYAFAIAVAVVTVLPAVVFRVALKVSAVESVVREHDIVTRGLVTCVRNVAERVHAFVLAVYVDDVAQIIQLWYRHQTVSCVQHGA